MNESEIIKKTAAKIRIRRLELHMSQEKLAERADLHVNFVGGIERAQKNPSLTTLYKLAMALKISICDLL